MILKRLLGDVPASEFLAGYYLKLPYAQPRGCRDLAPLADWAAVERILGQPGADVVAARAGVRWDGQRAPSFADARRLVAEGYTVGIRHAHQHDDGLAALADDFGRAFRAPVDVHLYCTPAGQPGFGWHYDAEEVFVLQTVGEKEWCLRKNTVHPWPLMEAIPADQKYGREIMPLMRCALAAGDWLYIPGGYWHRTQAGSESISLSVGVRAAVALDVFDFLRPQLMESLKWRQRLPPAGAAAPTEDQEPHYRELFAALGRDLAERLSRDDIVRAFLDRDVEKRKDR